MSKYTTEVRFVCEQYAGLSESVGYDRVNEVIDASRARIFGDYPIFDESYRGILEKKILKHYYTREISEETVGLWKLRLNTKMNEIMPYFNKLYRSELIEFNPLYDIDLTRDFHRDTKGDNKGSSDGSNTGHNDAENWNMYQDTPQGGLTGIRNEEYLTNVTHNTSAGNNSNSSESNYENSMNGLEDYIEHIKGVNGGASYSKRIKEFREQFLNIDMQVIDSLKNLFFYLW